MLGVYDEEKPGSERKMEAIEVKSRLAAPGSQLKPYQYMCSLC